MSKETIRAWHFSPVDKRLTNGDGRIIRAGRTLKVSETPVLCKSGLHASVKLIDALKHAPGPYLWRVELSGTVVTGDDKLAASERKALWGFDATDLLRRFARKCALDVIHLWDAPDVVRRYLESGDESIREAARDAAQVARDAAWAAACAAVGGAAWDAARSAARTAWDVTWAARDAAQVARDAAWAAACAAVGGAAWAEQAASLDDIVIEYAKQKGYAP